MEVKQMEKTKVLKIKVGEVFINGQTYPVMQTAWKKVSKDKKTTYYEVRSPIFVQEIEPKQQEEQYGQSFFAYFI